MSLRSGASRPRMLVVLLPLTLAALGLTLAAQRRATETRTRIPGGQFEASGVVAVPGTRGVLFVDDGNTRQIFWLEFSDSGAAAPAVPVNLGATPTDMEGMATDGTYFYVVGSQSQSGGRNAVGLVRFTFDARTRQASGVEMVRGLRNVLTSQVPELARIGRGRAGPINIEGLTWDVARGRLLLGLRSPLADRKAVVLAASLIDPARPLSAENLKIDPAMIRLDLGGLAIRGLGYDAVTRRILVVGGSPTEGAATTSRVFEWDGTAGSVPLEVVVIPGADKPEGITRITLGGRSRTLVVFDSGSYQLLE